MLRPSLREVIALAEEISRADGSVVGGPWTENDVFDLLANTELSQLARDGLIRLRSKTASRRKAIYKELADLNDADKAERKALVDEIRSRIPTAFERCYNVVNKQ